MRPVRLDESSPFHAQIPNHHPITFVPPNLPPRSVVEAVENRVGKVVSVGASVGRKPTARQSPPHDNASNTRDVKLGHHPDQTKRFVEVTMTAAVPLTMGGVDLLECLLSTRTVVSARVDESPAPSPAGEPVGVGGGAARHGGVEAAGVDGADGNVGAGGDGGEVRSTLGAWFLGWGGGKRHGGAATLEDVDPTDWDAPLFRQ